MSINSGSFIERLQKRTAQVAIGPSALRNQGAGGVVSGARLALAGINLKKYGASTEGKFAGLLARDTARILEHFPAKAQSWGAARKALNLFLRDAAYNIDLTDAYNLKEIRHLLEIPLDRDIATALLGQPEGIHLPKWQAIKSLTQAMSDQYQEIAQAVAARYQVNRVDLDVYFWHQNPLDNLL